MIQINEKSLKNLNKNLSLIGRELIEEAGKINNRFTPLLIDGGNIIRNEIIRSMQTTPRSGKSQTRSFKRSHKRTVQPSLPGFPPAIDLGNLVGGVIYDVGKMFMEVGVISTGLGRTTREGFTSYAEILELTDNLKIQRPFLQPAVEKHEDRIMDNMLTVMSRHIIKAVGKGTKR